MKSKLNDGYIRFCNGVGRLLLVVAVLFATASCSKTKEARESLTQAQALYDAGEYPAAKLAIDTIRLRYPREIAVLKEALNLMRLVERSESERNIIYCDSLLPVRLEEAETLKKGFVYERDSAYEDIGHYVWKQQTVERNVERSYVRCGVDEKGEIYLASVYFGSRPINHTGLKLSLPDGTFAETAVIPYDGGMNYRFKDNGNTTEVVTYKGDSCLEAVNFIYAAPEKSRIRAEYTGGTSYTIYLGDNERNIIRATYDLAAVLSDIETMRREKEKSEKRILYLNEKLSLAGK